jgi:hypothetical protein
MLNIIERFSEHIRGIFAGWNVVNRDLIRVECVMNEVVTNTDMLYSLMIRGVFQNIKCSLIVLKD